MDRFSPELFSVVVQVVSFAKPADCKGSGIVIVVRLRIGRAADFAGAALNFAALQINVDIRPRVHFEAFLGC